MTREATSAARKMDTESDLLTSLQPYKYLWPTAPLSDDRSWEFDQERRIYTRQLAEKKSELAKDSRWPAMFPAPMCIVSTSDGEQVALEREVGASIVNRFPYVVAISICREQLSERHHPRSKFMRTLEAGRVAALQFLPPGPQLDTTLHAINSIPDTESERRITKSGLATRQAITCNVPVFEDAYMVYETRLANPQKDFAGHINYETPWVDLGSHRIYFLEIQAIQLREDIALGSTQIHWRALPSWTPKYKWPGADQTSSKIESGRYQKGYTPNYAFPAPNTIAFEYDDIREGMAIKLLPPLPEDQVEVDNDRARWPCFFPSSCGLITSWTDDGTPNLMPCGSTTVVSRDPLTISPCVSNAKINERYATRKSLEIIRKSGRFGCSVPFIHDRIIDAMKYAGNNSLAHDIGKVQNSGLTIGDSEFGPIIKEAPIHYDCEVMDEVRLGTHIMFLGKVKRIYVRDDVSPENPLEWCPWAGLEAT